MTTSTDCLVLVTGIPTTDAVDEDVVDEGKIEGEGDVAEGEKAATSDQKASAEDGQAEVDMVAVRYAHAMNFVKVQLEVYGEVKYINLPR